MSASDETTNPALRIEPTCDIDLCVELRIDFQKLMNGPIDAITEINLRKSTREHLARGFLDGTIFVLLATIEGRMVGCAMLQEQRIIPNLPIPSGRTGLILNVHVDDRFRQQGIGKALMRAIEAVGRTQGLDRLELKASEMGEPVYRKLGWRDVTGGKPMELSLN